MAKFIFGMQGLLNIKAKLEEQSQVEYGKALSSLEEEKEKLNDLYNKKEVNLESFRQSIVTGVKPSYLKSINDFIAVLDKKIETQIENIEKAEVFVEEKRQNLLSCMKDRKALEALKDKAKEEFFKEELKNEQKIIDEIVSYKYNKA